MSYVRQCGQALVSGSTLPLALAAVAVVLSTVSGWWALLAVVAAFLAGRGPGRGGSAAWVLASGVLLAALAVVVRPVWLVRGTDFVWVLVGAAMVPWFAGRFWRQCRLLTRAGWERAEQLERERRLVAEQARLRERARIAQDMHDLLGHELSLIALSAGALKLEPGLAERHRLVAQDIRSRAGAAVERLGEVIGVLREDNGTAPLGPADTDITALVDAARTAGLTVELRAQGDPLEAPTVVRHATHRVVQEALTNAAKHAPHSTTRVLLSHGAAETSVRVESGGGGTRAPLRGVGSGTGLISLDERVRLAGGVFAYGPRGGVFTVEARLPHAHGAAGGPVRSGAYELGESYEYGERYEAGGAGELPVEHRRARRGTARILLAACVLPLATGAVLYAVIVGWNMRSAARTVLSEENYSRLHVGQNRASAERLLPDHQTADRPDAAEPDGADVSCQYYARTANRFDDLSGDVYRVCFAQGRVRSLDAYGMRVSGGAGSPQQERQEEQEEREGREEQEEREGQEEPEQEGQEEGEERIA
ncbi:sensor histidine kinase [Streptomyces sp. NA04227]|uniref:sensor histidine kinase n=1 Tax=Streptomyces sp. NA04227 TaxID=2742136 RepID=UPI0015912EA8|nr:histidine kinase [Streptomyces sp. NA04227]QKW07030.1 sensor histidine kinase [Streptomyces sp. NA04227]